MARGQLGTLTRATPAVLRVAALIEQDADRIADRMMDAYTERIPSYAAANETSLADAHGWARASIVVATGIVSGRLTAMDLVDELKDVGRRRALQGIPLHDVLLANLIATELLWDEASARSPEDPEERLEIQTLFMDASVSLLQHAVVGLASGYLEIEGARAADEEHDMQAVVETIAGLRAADKSHQARAESRGIDLDTLRWCVVLRGADDDIGAHVRTLRRASPGAAVGRIGKRIIAFFPGESPPAVDLTPAGMASATDGPAGFRRASAALRVALHLNRDLVRYEEVVPLAMVLAGPDEDREAFIESQLGALIRDPLGDELMKSLAAYYGTGQSVAAAARELFVHRHTLEYRLSRIENALDVDIRAPEIRMMLELALALHGAPPPTRGSDTNHNGAP
jgi:hypothetical protein